MKHTILIFAILVLLIPAASLGAYDQIWGASVDLNMELPDIVGTTAALTTENSLGLWYRGSWSPAANIEFDGGLGFDGDLRFTVTNGFTFSAPTFMYELYPELDKAAFYGRTGMFSYTAGRQLFGDPAGLVINAPIDGVDASAELGRHIVSAGFGYTGITFKQSSEYFMTAGDLGDEILSRARLVEYAARELPAATEWLNLNVMFLASQDVSGDADAFNPMYLELYADGFLSNGTFLYDLSLIGQYGTGDVTTLAGIGRLGFSWLPGGPSRLGVDLLASTGDVWADRDEYLINSPAGTSLNQYLPVSIVSTQGYVIEFEVGNLTSLGLFYAHKPRKTHSWEVRTTTFLRTAEGPVSTGLVKNPAGGGVDGAFLGQELLASWFWRPRSDFGWDLKLGLMYTGSPVMLESFLQDYYLSKVPLLFRVGFDWSWSF